MTPADCQFLATLAAPDPAWGGMGSLPLNPDLRDFPMTLLPGVSELLSVGVLTPVDYSSDVQGIYNQGSEPSCVAYSTAGLASTQDFRADRSWDTLDGSRFYRLCGGNGREGIDSRLALDRARHDGIPLVSGAGSVRVGTYVFATQAPGRFRQEIAAAISLGHFCTIALLLPSDFGWSSSLNAQRTSGYHQIYGVGFTGLGDDDDVICVNSWGPAHGNNGRVKVKWGYLERDDLQNRYAYAFAVTPLVLPNPNPQPNPSPDYPAEMIRLVAQVRQQNGLPALNVHPALMQAARDYAKEMGVTANYSHTGKDGSSPWQRMQRAGYSGNGTWGENIAAGETDPSSPLRPQLLSTSSRVREPGAVMGFRPEGSFTAWMNSPGHRSNILNPAFTDIGVGYAHVPGSPYTHYWVQDFATSNAGPQPQPEPEPVTLRIDSVLGTRQIAAAAPGETFRVTGQGFGVGVVTARVDDQPCRTSVQNDGLLIVTAPPVPGIGILYVRREGLEIPGPTVAIAAPGPGPTPTPTPDPIPTPTPVGELEIKAGLPSRLNRTKVLLTAGVTYQGAGVLGTLTVSAGGQPLGAVQTLPSGLARLIVTATSGTLLMLAAVDPAGHRGRTTVPV